MTSQRIFNMNNIAKDINSLSSPDPISGICILQEWNRCWATIYVNYVHSQHGGPLFSAPLCMYACLTDVVSICLQLIHCREHDKNLFCATLYAADTLQGTWQESRSVFHNFICSAWRRSQLQTLSSWSDVYRRTKYVAYFHRYFINFDIFT